MSKKTGRQNREVAGILLSEEYHSQVDWNSFTAKFATIIGGGIAAVMGNPSGLARSASAFFDTLKDFKTESSPGRQSLELVLLCSAWALDKLIVENHVQESDAKNIAKKSIEHLKTSLKVEQLTLPHDFLTRPTGARPYQILRDKLLDDSKTLRLSTRETRESLEVRFDSAFKFALWDILSKRRADFQDLIELLSLPTAQQVDFDLQWKAYKQSLSTDFFCSPVFGQEDKSVALGDLYIPLRCRWKAEDTSTTDTYRNASQTEKTYVVETLDQCLLEWVSNTDQDDWLRLVGGGPGSGKSTCAKFFAATIAEFEDVRPLLIPLQSIRIQGTLRSSINNYFKDRTGSSFENGPLERKNVEDGPRLVLIFDGLDELVRPGEKSDELAREFIGWIVELRSELSGPTGLNHKILVTGRMPSFQVAIRSSSKTGSSALEVCNFLPMRTQSYRTEGEKAVFSNDEYRGSDELIKADQRSDWWQKYSTALGKDETVPDAIQGDAFTELTAEPLLCYLLALSGYLEENYEEAAKNPNIVYRALMDKVWERGWRGKSSGATALSRTDFNILFETMAIAAWHGGEPRVATIENFSNALAVMKSQDIFDNFCSENGDDVTNLAVNFYLKKSETEGRGFEFTHKSFGEYLTARALLRSAQQASKIASARLEYGAEEWLNIVRDGVTTNEISRFLKGEAHLLSAETALAIRNDLIGILEYALDSGLPVQKQERRGLGTWRQAEAAEIKGEVALLAVINSLTSCISMSHRDNARITIGGIDSRMKLGEFIHRIRGVRNFDLVQTQFFEWFEFIDCLLIAQDLIAFNFSGAIFRNCEFFSATISHSDFSFSNISNSGFMLSTCERSKFSFSTLQNCHFERANGMGSRFQHAEIANCQFSNAILPEADFDQANLKNVSFRDAKLTEANFVSANFDNVDFEGADLTGCTFGKINFDRVNFFRAKLEGTALHRSGVARQKPALFKSN